MTRSRTLARLRAAVLVSTILAVSLIPAFRAGAEEPPFEIVFPQTAEVTTHHDDWGARRAGGRAHRGNDLMAPKLTPVYAIAEGFVERVAESRRAGRYVVINHYGGWTSSYMHLNNDNPNTDDGRAPWSITVANEVEEGTYVSAGQLIGFVGDSGNAEWTSPHTHFELDLNGKSVDPGPLLAAAHSEALESLRFLAFYSGFEDRFSII